MTPRRLPHRKDVEIYIPLPLGKNVTDKLRVFENHWEWLYPYIFNLHSKILFSSLFVHSYLANGHFGVSGLQPNDLAVCCDAIHQGLHQMCVFRRVDPAGQLAVRNDNKASFFIEEADCAVK